MVKDIRYDNRPWRYELAWDVATPEILIAVHNDFIHEFKLFECDNHSVLAFERKLGLNGFLVHY